MAGQVTAKDSKGALKGVGKDKGDLGRLFISNLPEIFEFIKNAKKRQKLSELNNTINSLIKNKDLEKIIKNFGATGQLRSILNQLYEEEENLLRIKKEIKKLERERDLGIGGSRGEIQVDYDSKIAELKKKVDDIEGKIDQLKSSITDVGKRLDLPDDLLDQLRNSSGWPRPSPELIHNFMKNELKQIIKDLGFRLSPEALDRLATKLLNSSGEFFKDPRAFILNELARSSFVAEELRSSQRVADKLADWTREEILLGSKKIDGKLVLLDDVLKKMGLNIPERYSVIMTLELVAQKSPHSLPFNADNRQSLLAGIDALEEPETDFAKLVNDVRQSKTALIAKLTLDLVANSSLQDLRNGNVAIKEGDSVKLIKLEELLAKHGLSDADAKTLAARTRLIAQQQIMGGADPNSNLSYSTADDMIKGWRDVGKMSDDDFDRLVSNFSARDQAYFREHARNSLQFETKLEAHRMAALLATTNGELPGVSRQRLAGSNAFGLITRNFMELVGAAAAVIDIVLGAKDVVDAVKQRDALLGVAGGLSVGAGMVTLVAQLAALQSGAMFAAAVPLISIASVLGAIAFGVGMIHAEKKSEKEYIKAFKDALEPYKEYLKPGWEDKITDFVKKNWNWPADETTGSNIGS